MPSTESQDIIPLNTEKLFQKPDGFVTFLRSLAKAGREETQKTENDPKIFWQIKQDVKDDTQPEDVVDLQVNQTEHTLMLVSQILKPCK